MVLGAGVLRGLGLLRELSFQFWATLLWFAPARPFSIPANTQVLTAYPTLLRLEQVIAGTEGSGGEECNAAQGAGGEAAAWAIELLGKPLQL